MSNRIQGFKHSGFSARTWNRQHATRRKALLTALLAEISSEALRGDSLESILKRIVDCVVNRLPVAIASIILLNDEKTHFVRSAQPRRAQPTTAARTAASTPVRLTRLPARNGSFSR